MECIARPACRCSRFSAWPLRCSRCAARDALLAMRRLDVPDLAEMTEESAEEQHLAHISDAPAHVLGLPPSFIGHPNFSV